MRTRRPHDQGLNQRTWFSPYLLALVLSPIVFQTSGSLTCEKTGDTTLSALTLEAAGQNQIDFDGAQLTYDVSLPPNATAAVLRATPTDPAAQLGYQLSSAGVYIEGSWIGVGAGQKGMNLPLGRSMLVVMVKAPGGAQGNYILNVTVGCSQCDDGDACTDDSCNTSANSCLHQLVANRPGCEQVGSCGTCSAGTLCNGAGQCVPIGTDGDAPFQRVDIPGGISGDCKMMGDINGDGLVDLAVAGGGSAEPLTWYRAPDWQATTIASSAQEFSNYGTIGDVDGDGDADIVVPDGNLSPNNIFWYQNPGGAAASNPSAWVRKPIGKTGSWPKDVALTDYDSDGRMDVAVRPEGAQPVIFFQTATNVWAKTQLQGLNAGNEGMWSGDVSGDGRQDIIMAGEGALNPGGTSARTAANWTTFDIGTAPNDFKAFTADINGDGRVDVLFSSSESTADVVWYEQGGSPFDAWSRHVIEADVSQAHTLWAADMNLDGTMDVVVAAMGSQSLHIYYNENAQGTSWRDQLVDGASGSLHNGQVADVDDDGDYDIFGAAYTGNSPKAVLWRNKLDEVAGSLSLDSWTYKQITSNHTQVFGLCFPDVDRDGFKDVASGPYWYRNPGSDMSGTWTQNDLPYPGGASGVEAMLTLDVDGDSDVDVIAVTPDSRVWWLEHNGNNNWDAHQVASMNQADYGLSSQGYRTGQIIAGGKQELVISDGSAGMYTFTIANPPTNPWTRRLVTSATSDEGVGIGDFDGDGDLDIAGLIDDYAVEWYENPGGTSAQNWTSYRVANLSNVTWLDRCAVADLNGDGRSDIIVTEENSSSSGAETYWLERPVNGKSVPWAQHLLTSQGSTNSMEVADFDGDGDIDVITGEHVGALKIVIWENDGTGSFVPHTVDSGKESHYGVRPVDLDNDGDLDIVSIAWNASQLIHLWRNDAIP